MSWTTENLAAVSALDEIRVAPDRGDGTPGTSVIVWAVEHGGELYARSARGPEGGWYRRALASGTGRIQSDAGEYDVAFVDVSSESAADHAAIDAAYHAKYDRYGARTVGSVVGNAAHRVTVRITPIE